MTTTTRPKLTAQALARLSWPRWPFVAALIVAVLLAVVL